MWKLFLSLSSSIFCMKLIIHMSCFVFWTICLNRSISEIILKEFMSDKKFNCLHDISVVKSIFSWFRVICILQNCYLCCASFIILNFIQDLVKAIQSLWWICKAQSRVSLMKSMLLEEISNITLRQLSDVKSDCDCEVCFICIRVVLVIFIWYLKTCIAMFWHRHFSTASELRIILMHLSQTSLSFSIYHMHYLWQHHPTLILSMRHGFWEKKKCHKERKKKKRLHTPQ